MPGCLDLIAAEVPGLAGWIEAAPLTPMTGDLADLLTPLSGGIAIGERLSLPGDVPAAMVADALSGAQAQWALRIRRAVIRRAEDPLTWSRCLIDPRLSRAALLGQLSDLEALSAWLLARPVRPAIRGRLQAATFRLMLAPPLPVPSVTEAIAAAVSRAPVDLSGRGEAVWERQRSGFLDTPELLGDLFNPLLLVEAAAEAGLDAAPLLERVVASRVGEGLRYYRGCPTIPRDADDAAALLLAARACGGQLPAALQAEAEAILAAATRDGVCTWIDDAGAPTDWLGPRCPGVGARVVLALQTPEAAAWLVERQQPDGGWTALHYPSRIIATSLALRALAGMGGFQAARDRGVAWLTGQQGADGGVGQTALETAEALRTGVLTGIAAAEAAAFLVARQRWDGHWPGAPLFLCPHPGGAMRPLTSAPLTTAIVLAGLTHARGAM